MPFDAPILPKSILPDLPAIFDGDGGGGGAIKYYRLVFKRTKRCNLLEWVHWLSKPWRKFVGDMSQNGRRVSAIFLGIDHNYSFKDTRPILFESMVFGGPHDQDQRRYRSYGATRWRFMLLCRREFGASPGVNRAYMRPPRITRSSVVRWRRPRSRVETWGLERARKSWRKGLPD